MLRVRKEHYGTRLNTGSGDVVLNETTPQEVLKRLVGGSLAWLVEDVAVKKVEITAAQKARVKKDKLEETETKIKTEGEETNSSESVAGTDTETV